MGRFLYKALTPDGNVVEDVMEAQSRDNVVARLRDADQLPISVEAAGTDDGPAEHSLSRGDATPDRRRVRVPTEALILFTRQLGTLLNARLPLEQALAVVAQATTATMGGIAGNLRQRVREGATLSEAMAAQPHAFDPFYRAIVVAGEGGGALEDTLGRLAQYLERAQRLRTQVRSALIYPAILLAAALVSVTIIMTVVLPQFEALFRSTASDLPWATKAIFAIAGVLRDHGLTLGAVGAAAGVGIYLYLRSAVAVGRLDRFILALPWVGRLVQTMEFERIFRSLAVLIGNGVGLAKALELAGAVARNRVVKSAVADANGRVKHGERLTDAFAAQPVVPRMAVHLIRVGDESGELETMLTKLADIFSTEVESELKRLITVIEPALIVLIGLFVAVIIVSLLSAIVGVNAIVL